MCGRMGSRSADGNCRLVRSMLGGCSEVGGMERATGWCELIECRKESFVMGVGLFNICEGAAKRSWDTSVSGLCGGVVSGGYAVRAGVIRGRKNG